MEQQWESMENLISEIREITKKQQAISRVDEVRVMRTMLNDPNFTVSIYERNKGIVGTRCPREEATTFVGNVSSAITGLENKAAQELANQYEFTKRDAVFLLDNSRDFIQTYLSTGRKLPIIQAEDSEATIQYRTIQSREKSVPTNDGGKQTTTVPAFQKVICKSKCPKYKTE